MKSVQKRQKEIWKVKKDREKRKERLLREITVKIGLKQEEEKKIIVVEVLLDSKVTELVISKESVKKY